MASIFVAIPSLDDTELIPTIENCLSSISRENEVTIGVAYSVIFNSKKKVDQIKEKINKHKNVKFKSQNFNTNCGVGYGRLAAYSFYDNEDYFLQIDSHTLFSKNWDIKLINLLNDATKIYGEKTILTGYLPKYMYFNARIEERKPLENTELTKSYFLKNKSLSDKHPGCNTCKIWEMLPFWEDRPLNEEESANNFIKADKISAGFVFGNNIFAKDYKKFFPFIYRFWEEEVIMSIEIIDNNYSIIHPVTENLLYHLYGIHINNFGGKRENIGETNILKYKKSIQKNLDEYFIKNINAVEKFEKYADIEILSLVNKWRENVQKEK